MLAKLKEVKDYLRIDGNSEDNTLTSLLLSSKAVLKSRTQVEWEANNETLSKLWQLEYIKSIYLAPDYKNQDGLNIMMSDLLDIVRSKGYGS